MGMQIMLYHVGFVYTLAFILTTPSIEYLFLELRKQ